MFYSVVFVFCLCIFLHSLPTCVQSCTNLSSCTHCTCIHLLQFQINYSAISVPIPSSSVSTANHYIWFQLAVCGVECPIGNFQGSVQREWCTRLSSHCAHYITTVSQHLSTAAKSSVQHCSGSHTHCDTGQGQQLSDQGIHYTKWWVRWYANVLAGPCSVAQATPNLTNWTH